MRFRLALAALFLLIIPAAADEARLLKTAQSLYDGVRQETLPNGLRVYLKPVPGSPVVTTMVAYLVGAADEELDQTGLSHYLEHLMFKGTDKLFPGDIDRLTQRNGGSNNANTSEDMTVYYFNFAADRWKTALDIEADRMRNLRIDTRHEFEQEKGAVISELDMYEDQPWDLEMKVLLPALFGPKTPYGHPVIGEKAHVRGATAEVIKKHYDRWYHPNNAVLVVAGGFDEADALAAIQKLFGPIPRGELPPRKPVPDSKPRTQVVRQKFDSKFPTPRLLCGFNTVAETDPDAIPLDVVATILTSGKTSRLHRRLIEDEGTVTLIESGHTPGRYPGWFAIQAELFKVEELKKVEDAVREEIQKLATEGPTDGELKRVRRAMMAAHIFAHESVHELADTIARGALTQDMEFVRRYLPDLMKVSAADVKRVAQKYLVDQKPVVIESIPKAGDKEKGDGTALSGSRRGESAVARSAARDTADEPGRSGAGPGPGGGRIPRCASGYGRETAAKGRIPRCASGYGRETAAKGSANLDLKAAKTVVLPNGLKLLLLENHRLPIVVAEAQVRKVRLYEPADKVGVAVLMGNVLDEGTAGRTGPEIARLIEDTGGSLTTGSSGGTVKVLADDLELGLDLLFDCLMNPAFRDDDVESKRDQLLATLAEEEKQPDQRALRAFRAAVYGEHPFARPSARSEVVKKLTPRDLKDFHQRVFGPNNAVVAVVGDFDAQKAAAGIERRTAAWKQVQLPKLEIAAPPKREKFTQTIITDPTASQLTLFLGHLGVKRDNPDYYTLLVMDHVLGTGSGFTDRLSSTLRDRQGLAYSVSARITGNAGEEPGTFTASIGTFPDKFAEVKAGFLKEIRRIREEVPAKDEVEDVKKYLTGTLAFSLTTVDQAADLLLAIDRYKLGADYLNDYRKAVEAVTPEDVRAAARKYLDPDRMVLTAAGPVDADAKPLSPKGKD